MHLCVDGSSRPFNICAKIDPNNLHTKWNQTGSDVRDCESDSSTSLSPEFPSSTSVLLTAKISSSELLVSLSDDEYKLLLLCSALNFPSNT